jgi:hypothetical protein
MNVNNSPTNVSVEGSGTAEVNAEPLPADTTSNCTLPFVKGGGE